VPRSRRPPTWKSEAGRRRRPGCTRCWRGPTSRRSRGADEGQVAGAFRLYTREAPQAQAPRNQVLARPNINVLDAVEARIVEGIGERVKALIKDGILARNQASKRRCNRLTTQHRTWCLLVGFSQFSLRLYGLP